MIADLHTHTAYAHGNNSVREMFAAGQARGLKIHGFSEHSPRPEGYNYPKEYRDKLNAGFDAYVRDVRELAREQAEKANGARVLLGLEMDWIDGELDFMRNVAAAHDFAYIIGGLHFLGAWGFDADPADWAPLSFEQRADCYVRYYQALTRMARSGLFQIAAHPDLIKLFSVQDFHAWLALPGSLDHVAGALTAIRDAGMAMEISSAGLRKPCAEIYPGPAILGLAADLGVPVSFGSDGHCVNTIAAGFPELARAARAAGYTHSLVFDHGAIERIPF